jgi:hypothetical protein
MRMRLIVVFLILMQSASAQDVEFSKCHYLSLLSSTMEKGNFKKNAINKAKLVNTYLYYSQCFSVEDVLQIDSVVNEFRRKDWDTIKKRHKFTLAKGLAHYSPKLDVSYRSLERKEDYFLIQDLESCRNKRLDPLEYLKYSED